MIWLEMLLFMITRDYLRLSYLRGDVFGLKDYDCSVM
jgi:hypothetical protein